MPVIDLPLSELKRYQGRNPRPDNFDEYWQTALAELDRTPPAPRLVENNVVRSDKVACYDLWFTGVGGATIYAKYIRPRASGKYPTVLQFHGYSGNSGDWFQKLAWAYEGFCIAAMDCRGQGGKSQDVGGFAGNTLSGHIIRGLDDPNPQRMLFRDIFLDTAQLARAVTSFPEVDAQRLGAFGGSQGGALTMACAALEPRIRRAAPVYPFLCDYQRVWEMDLAKDAYAELRDYFRRFDPTHARAADTFRKLGYIDLQHLAPRINAEVLMYTGLMDAICPPSSQFAAFNKLTGRKEMILYPDFGHEQLPGESDRTFAFMQKL